MSTPNFCILSIRPYVQRLASYRPDTDTSDPQFELAVKLDTYIRDVSLSADGMASVSRPSFVGRHMQSVRFLLHDQSEAAVRAVLSFPGYDLYLACGRRILSYVQEAVKGGKLKVVATISCVAEYHANYDEGSTVASVEARSEEERSQKRRKVVPAETVLEEKEWEGRDGKGGTCTCTVCMEELGAGERVARMPCSHCFHKECIWKWLVEESNSCPLCRFEVE